MDAFLLEPRASSPAKITLMNEAKLLNEFRALISEAHQKSNDQATHELLDWLYDEMRNRFNELNGMEGLGKISSKDGNPSA